jgi:hypothetical protein
LAAKVSFSPRNSLTIYRNVVARAPSKVFLLGMVHSSGFIMSSSDWNRYPGVTACEPNQGWEVTIASEDSISECVAGLLGFGL